MDIRNKQSGLKVSYSKAPSYHKLFCQEMCSNHTSKIDLAIAEGRLTWLVYIIGKFLYVFYFSSVGLVFDVLYKDNHLLILWLRRSSGIFYIFFNSSWMHEARYVMRIRLLLFVNYSRQTHILYNLKQNLKIQEKWLLHQFGNFDKHIRSCLVIWWLLN